MTWMNTWWACVYVLSLWMAYLLGYRSGYFANLKGRIDRQCEEIRREGASVTAKATAIADALAEHEHAGVYHDTDHPGPLVATWVPERKH